MQGAAVLPMSAAQRSPETDALLAPFQSLYSVVFTCLAYGGKLNVLRKTTAKYIQLHMDSVSPEKRSWVMAQIKGQDTKPEKIVRSLLHSMGYRFRLQRKDLPGKPDIVLPKYQTVIFVHGCYWHRHDCPNGQRIPKSRLDFWLPKLERNRERDIKNHALLRVQGWNVLVIWECQLKNINTLQQNIQSFLNKYEYTKNNIRVE